MNRTYRFLCGLLVWVTVGAGIATAQLIPLEGGGDNLLTGLEFSLERLRDLDNGRADIVHTVELAPRDESVTDVYYPVWEDESVIFLGQNRRGGYRFLELQVGAETRLLEVLEFQVDGGGSDPFGGGAFGGLEENEPPLRNPVVNPETGVLAFLLIRFNPQALQIYVWDREAGSEARRVYEVTGKRTIRSLDWVAQDRLMFMESEPRQPFEVVSIDVTSGARTLVARDISYPTVSYQTKRVACFAEDDMGRQTLTIMDANGGSLVTTELTGRLSRISWDPEGRYVACISEAVGQKGISIWDTDRDRVIEVAATRDIYIAELGAIYLDYKPVWDNEQRLYYATAEFDFANRIFAFDPARGTSTVVFDAGETDSFAAISAFDVSKFIDAGVPAPEGARQLIVCGLKSLRSGRREATMFFYDSPVGGAE